MWRLLRFAALSKVPGKLPSKRSYSSYQGGGIRRFIGGIITSTGVLMGGGALYGKYYSKDIHVVSAQINTEKDSLLILENKEDFEEFQFIHEEVTSKDLHVLLTHAIKRIKQLQVKVNVLESQMLKKQQDLERAVQDRTASLKAKLHKEIPLIETAGNMVRLKEIMEYLKGKKKKCDKSNKAQALLLAVEAIMNKISTNDSKKRKPLGKDIAILKLFTDDNDEFINSVLSSIPSEAVYKGVFTKDSLNQWFENVKRVCQQVGLINEDNNSLSIYLISYVFSILRKEIEIKTSDQLNTVITTISELDNFDILSIISYYLKTDDLELALYYAEKLEGEAKKVAKCWMKEVKLLWETEKAVKALFSYATALSV